MPMRLYHTPEGCTLFFDNSTDNDFSLTAPCKLEHKGITWYDVLAPLYFYTALEHGDNVAAGKILQYRANPHLVLRWSKRVRMNPDYDRESSGLIKPKQLHAQVYAYPQ